MILDIAILSIKNGPLLIQRLDLVTGSDPRLSDARTPLPHTHSASEILGLGEAQIPRLLRAVQDHLVYDREGDLVISEFGEPVFANP